MATKYVDSVSGSNSNNGNSKALAYLTYDYAVQQLGTNDTLIFVNSGTDYVWTSRAIPAGVTFEGEVLPQIHKGQYIRMNGGGSLIQSQLNGSFTCRNIWWYNTTTDSNTSQLYPLRSFTGNRVLLFEDCLFSNHSASMSTGSRSGFIGGGSSLAGDLAASYSATFRRCVIWAIESLSSGLGGAFFKSFTVNATVLFENCTYYSTTPTLYALTALSASGGLSGNTPTTYRNCIIDNNSGTNLALNAFIVGYGAQPTSNNAATVENTVYRNVTTTSITFTDCVNDNPDFLDVANNDFRLKPDSPAINLGQLV